MKLRVVGGPEPWTIKVFIDDIEITNLVSLTFTAGLDNLAHVTLTFQPKCVDFDVEAEAEGGDRQVDRQVDRSQA